jgi:hypothetical protein
MKIKGSTDSIINSIIRMALWIGIGIIWFMLLYNSCNKGDIIGVILALIFIGLSVFYVTLNLKKIRRYKFEEAKTHG